MSRRNVAIFAGTIAIISIIANIFLFLGKRGGFQTDHPYLDPEQGYYNNADLLVNLRPLREQLTSLAQGKNVSIYFEFLNTGANIRINDTPFFPGSLMKIPVAMAVMKKIESGAWSMSDQLVLTDADKNPAYGDLYKLPAGTTFTVADLLNKLLVQSDDTARAIFIRNLGQQTVEDVLTYLGLDDVVSSDLKVTAQRYSNFWRALYTASYISAESSEKLLKIMAAPHDMSLLPAGLPAGVEISHKVGIYGDVNSDSGIVYVPHRHYILTVMVQTSSTSERDQVMEEASRAAYQYVTQ